MTLKIEGDKMGGFHMLRKNVSAGKVNFIVFIIFVFILGGSVELQINMNKKVSEWHAVWC